MTASILSSFDNFTREDFKIIMGSIPTSRPSYCQSDFLAKDLKRGRAFKMVTRMSDYIAQLMSSLEQWGESEKTRIASSLWMGRQRGRYSESEGKSRRDLGEEMEAAPYPWICVGKYNSSQLPSPKIVLWRRPNGAIRLSDAVDKGYHREAL